MLAWLAANLGNILVVTVLLCVVGLIVRNQVRRKKQGRSSCSCGCGGCALHETCGSGKNTVK